MTPTADLMASFSYDKKDGRWRILVEAPDGSCRASEERTLEKAFLTAEALAGDLTRQANAQRDAAEALSTPPGPGHDNPHLLATGACVCMCAKCTTWGTCICSSCACRRTP